MWRDADTACAVLGEATIEWPDAAGLLGRPRPRTTRWGRWQAAEANRRKILARRQARAAQKRTHTKYVQDSHKWAAVGAGAARCADCLMWKSSDVAHCPGASAEWSSCISEAVGRGHVLQKGILYEPGRGSPLQILACVRCGSYTTGAKLLGLADACHAATAAGKGALAQLAKGRHPKPGRHPAWYAPCHHRIVGQQYLAP